MLIYVSVHKRRLLSIPPKAPQRLFIMLCNPSFCFFFAWGLLWEVWLVVTSRVATNQAISSQLTVMASCGWNQMLNLSKVDEVI